MAPIQVTLKSIRGSILLAVILALIFVFVGLNSQAQQSESQLNSLSILESKSGFSGDWKAELGFESTEEDKDDSKSVGAVYRILSSYKLNDYVRLKGDFRIKTGDGRVQSRFSEFNSEPLDAREAVVEIFPTKYFMLAGGILNQGDLNNRILVSNWASFPGIKEKLFSKNGPWTLSLEAQQTVPGSQSNNTERNEKEALPSFYTETLALDYNTLPLRFRTQISHFAYNDLPAKVADSSELLGNTVFGDTADARFAFDFEGYALQARLDARINKTFGASLMTELTENQKAPTAASRGQLIEAHLSVNFGSMALIPKYFKLFKESDVVPGYYTSYALGGTNREGQGVGLDIIFEKLNFKVVIENSQMKPINFNKAQNDRDRLLVKLETLYVSF